jgi:hypothetical protein
MTPDALSWPVVYAGGKVLRFAPADDFGGAYFGGPLEQSFAGQSFGPEPLHRVFTFSPAGLPQPAGHNLQGRLSLFYGLRFSGCDLRYKVPVMDGVNAQYVQDYSQAVSVEHISPAESSSDWPYTGYPLLLPYIPLKEQSRTEVGPEDFSEHYTWQGLEGFTGDELVVVVPAIARLGVSMWGRSGDDEAVQIIFRYSYRTRLVHATNQCT